MLVHSVCVHMVVSVCAGSLCVCPQVVSACAGTLCPHGCDCLCWLTLSPQSQPLDANRGFTGDTCRLVVEYNIDAGAYCVPPHAKHTPGFCDSSCGTDVMSTAHLPATFILKTSMNTVSGRKNCIHGERHREAVFYDHIIRGSAPQG